MRVDVITLFPEMFSVVSELGVTGRAHQKGIWSLKTWNPRVFTEDVHHTVDDRPYGGGPGMVMLAEPLVKTLNAIRAEHTSLGLHHPLYLLSPVGQVFKQEQAQALSQTTGFILLCGRYEGIDQRFINHYVDGQISLGDFVLSGGEIAALAVLDSMVRLLPGVLNTLDSALQDSFHEAQSGLLDSPHYTRPEVFEGEPVPGVLLSGHHKNIAQWRREQSLRLTAQHRPDLIKSARNQGWLSKKDEQFLRELCVGNE
ncbi:tRNA (guanosine(37)-N1)-methyltransferase TrmD [Pelistega europaea]|uniref:tRNA (guanine-N(1)-)-methyltransferase n=1 Tax=Pelistega europaea TaxID=106147 RepID=A0A7Y4LD85_9BURK|nr:tRNA (guanosine(37)-N1)-methyltransferase TrmD [Pelistega europaea]NOL50302.1 tRNA (guanosine(37)-N1)-methyltransferase TrmD [Pelistega europaea]